MTLPRPCSLVTRLSVAAVCAVGLLLATGCQHDRLARRQIAQRQRSFNFAVDRIYASEARNPQQLEYTVGVLGKTFERKVQRTQEMPANVVRYFEPDFERWQKTDYLKAIVEYLSGDLPNIEVTAILLLL